MGRPRRRRWRRVDRLGPVDGGEPYAGLLLVDPRRAGAPVRGRGRRAGRARRPPRASAGCSCRPADRAGRPARGAGGVELQRGGQPDAQRHAAPGRSPRWRGRRHVRIGGVRWAGGLGRRSAGHVAAQPAGQRAVGPGHRERDAGVRSRGRPGLVGDGPRRVPRLRSGHHARPLRGPGRRRPGAVRARRRWVPGRRPLPRRWWCLPGRRVPWRRWRCPRGWGRIPGRGWWRPRRGGGVPGAGGFPGGGFPGGGRAPGGGFGGGQGGAGRGNAAEVIARAEQVCTPVSSATSAGFPSAYDGQVYDCAGQGAALAAGAG